VFKHLDFTVPENVVAGVIAAKPGVIEVVLNNLRVKIQQYGPRFFILLFYFVLFCFVKTGWNPSRFLAQRMNDEVDDEEPTPVAPVPVPAFRGAPAVAAPTNAQRRPAAAPVAAPAPAPAARAPAAPANKIPVRAQQQPPPPQQQQHHVVQQPQQPQMVLGLSPDIEETVEILQVKIRKLEQLVKLKDKRIEGVVMWGFGLVFIFSHVQNLSHCYLRPHGQVARAQHQVLVESLCGGGFFIFLDSHNLFPIYFEVK
jgi:hypothetical protein